LPLFRAGELDPSEIRRADIASEYPVPVTKALSARSTAIVSTRLVPHGRGLLINGRRGLSSKSAKAKDKSVVPGSFGGVSTRFRPYFDLYPIEVSINLVDWTAFVMLQRTNSSTNAFTYTDSESVRRRVDSRWQISDGAYSNRE
jgi:hypothetical protein